jgi:pimeloyl-ACP methyl ester carboxylesterase
MPEPTSLYIKANGLLFHILRWASSNKDTDTPSGIRSSEKQKSKTALLTHGTGMVAASWWLVAPLLAQAGYTVYAIDRRGHGQTECLTKDDNDSYEFLDFAEDINAIVSTLALQNIYAIGHSAGGTDLLLAAALYPDIFRRVFVIDPTLSHPAKPGAQLPDEALDTLQRIAKKRGSFENISAFNERALKRPPFSLFHNSVYRAHIKYALDAHPDGSVHLCCSPATEQELMTVILRAMFDCYFGDQRGDPFAQLVHIQVPTAIAGSGQSAAIYKKMVDVGWALVPAATRIRFPDQEHCVPMEAPELTVQTILSFAHQATTPLCSNTAPH